MRGQDPWPGVVGRVGFATFKSNMRLPHQEKFWSHGPEAKGAGAAV